VYLFANVFNGVIWLAGGFYFSNIIYPTDYTPLSFFLFVLGVKCFGANLEKYTDSDTGYSIQNRFVLSNFEVLFFRLSVNILQPAEWLYRCVVGYVVYSNTNSFFSFVIFFFLVVILIDMITELCALISSKIYLKNILSFFIWGFALACLVLSFVPLSIKPLFYPSLDFIVLYLFVSVLFFLVFRSNLSFLARFRQYKFKETTKSMISQGIADKMKKPTALKMLIVKELTFLFKYKINFILSAFAYTIMSLFFTNEEEYLFIAFAFFIVDFSMMYGFNYLGVEDETLVLPLLSSVDKSIIIKAKNIVLLTVSACGTLLIIPIMLMKYPTAIIQLKDSIIVSMLTLSIMLLCSSYLSINNYENNNSKKKYTVRKIMYMVVALISISILYDVARRLPAVKLLFLVFVVLLTVVTLYMCIINPSLFANRLRDKERKILDSLV